MKQSLLDKAKSAVVPTKNPCFFDKLSASDKAEITELVDAYLAGNLPNIPCVRDLHRKVLAPNGFTFSMRQFTDWVAKYAQAQSLRASEKCTTTGRESGAGNQVRKQRRKARDS